MTNYGTLGGLFGLGNAEELRKRRVWEKGRVIPNYLPSEWRWDDFGKPIKWSEYGDRNAAHGWEIDHITPRAWGGGDEIANLRPLHYRNNARLGGLLGALSQR